MDFFYLFLLALAASRVVHLVSDDVFPFGYLRDRLDRSSSVFAQWLGHGLKCTFCCSVYAGAAAAGLALWQGWAPGDPSIWIFLVLWWAYAQAIVLIEGVVFAVMGD
jgi:hypothetical protein